MIASPDDPGLDFLLSYYKAQSQLAFIQTLIDKFNCDPNNSQYTKLRAGYQKQYHDLNIQLEHRIIEWEAAQQLTAQPSPGKDRPGTPARLRYEPGPDTRGRELSSRRCDGKYHRGRL